MDFAKQKQRGSRNDVNNQDLQEVTSPKVGDSSRNGRALLVAKKKSDLQYQHVQSQYNQQALQSSNSPSKSLTNSNESKKKRPSVFQPPSHAHQWKQYNVKQMNLTFELSQLANDPQQVNVVKTPISARSPDPTGSNSLQKSMIQPYAGFHLIPAAAAKINEYKDQNLEESLQKIIKLQQLQKILNKKQQKPFEVEGSPSPSFQTSIYYQQRRGEINLELELEAKKKQIFMKEKTQHPGGSPYVASGNRSPSKSFINIYKTSSNNEAVSGNNSVYQAVQVNQELASFTQSDQMPGSNSKTKRSLDTKEFIELKKSGGLVIEGTPLSKMDRSICSQNPQQVTIDNIVSPEIKAGPLSPVVAPLSKTSTLLLGDKMLSHREERKRSSFNQGSTLISRRQAYQKNYNQQKELREQKEPIAKTNLVFEEKALQTGSDDSDEKKPYHQNRWNPKLNIKKFTTSAEILRMAMFQQLKLQDGTAILNIQRQKSRDPKMSNQPLFKTAEGSDEKRNTYQGKFFSASPTVQIGTNKRKPPIIKLQDQKRGVAIKKGKKKTQEENLMSQSFGSGLSPFRKSLASPRDAMCMSNTQTKFEKEGREFESKMGEIKIPQPQGAGSLPAAERGRIPEISDLKVHGTNATKVVIDQQRELLEDYKNPQITLEAQQDHRKRGRPNMGQMNQSCEAPSELFFKGSSKSDDRKELDLKSTKGDGQSMEQQLTFVNLTPNKDQMSSPMISHSEVSTRKNIEKKYSHISSITGTGVPHVGGTFHNVETLEVADQTPDCTKSTQPPIFSPNVADQMTFAQKVQIQALPIVKQESVKSKRNSLLQRGFHFDSNKTSVIAHMNKNAQKQMFLNTARTDKKFFSNEDNSSDLKNTISLNSKQNNLEVLAKTTFMTPQNNIGPAQNANMSIESNSIEIGDNSHNMKSALEEEVPPPKANVDLSNVPPISTQNTMQSVGKATQAEGPPPPLPVRGVNLEKEFTFSNHQPFELNILRPAQQTFAFKTSYHRENTKAFDPMRAMKFSKMKSNNRAKYANALMVHRAVETTRGNEVSQEFSNMKTPQSVERPPLNVTGGFSLSSENYNEMSQGVTGVLGKGIEPTTRGSPSNLTPNKNVQLSQGTSAEENRDHLRPLGDHSEVVGHGSDSIRIKLAISQTKNNRLQVSGEDTLDKADHVMVGGDDPIPTRNPIEVKDRLDKQDTNAIMSELFPTNKSHNVQSSQVLGDANPLKNSMYFREDPAQDMPDMEGHGQDLKITVQTNASHSLQDRQISREQFLMQLPQNLSSEVGHSKAFGGKNAMVHLRSKLAKDRKRRLSPPRRGSPSVLKSQIETTSKNNPRYLKSGAALILPVAHARNKTMNNNDVEETNIILLNTNLTEGPGAAGIGESTAHQAAERHATNQQNFDSIQDQNSITTDPLSPLLVQKSSKKLMNFQMLMQELNGQSHAESSNELVTSNLIEGSNTAKMKNFKGKILRPIKQSQTPVFVQASTLEFDKVRNFEIDQHKKRSKEQLGMALSLFPPLKQRGISPRYNQAIKQSLLQDKEKAQKLQQIKEIKQFLLNQKEKMSQITSPRNAPFRPLYAIASESKDQSPHYFATLEGKKSPTIDDTSNNQEKGSTNNYTVIDPTPMVQTSPDQASLRATTVEVDEASHLKSNRSMKLDAKALQESARMIDSLKSGNRTNMEEAAFHNSFQQDKSLQDYIDAEMKSSSNRGQIVDSGSPGERTDNNIEPIYGDRRVTGTSAERSHINTEGTPLQVEQTGGDDKRVKIELPADDRTNNKTVNVIQAKTTTLQLGAKVSAKKSDQGKSPEKPMVTNPSIRQFLSKKMSSAGVSSILDEKIVKPQLISMKISDDPSIKYLRRIKKNDFWVDKNKQSGIISQYSQDYDKLCLLHQGSQHDPLKAKKYLKYMMSNQKQEEIEKALLQQQLIKKKQEQLSKFYAILQTNPVDLSTLPPTRGKSKDRPTAGGGRSIGIQLEENKNRPQQVKSKSKIFKKRSEREGDDSSLYAQPSTLNYGQLNQHSGSINTITHQVSGHQSNELIFSSAKQTKLNSNEPEKADPPLSKRPQVVLKELKLSPEFSRQAVNLKQQQQFFSQEEESIILRPKGLEHQTANPFKQPKKIEPGLHLPSVGGSNNVMTNAQSKLNTGSSIDEKIHSEEQSPMSNSNFPSKYNMQTLPSSQVEASFRGKKLVKGYRMSQQQQADPIDSIIRLQGEHVAAAPKTGVDFFKR